MSLVRFASLCDTCGRRSSEYEQWHRCRDCDDHACPYCTAPGSEREEGRSKDGVDYETTTVLCNACAEQDDAPDDRDEAYERAASRARSNDFKDTGGKDWT